MSTPPKERRATVNVTSASFTTLCGLLTNGSVQLHVSHSGSTITDFSYEVRQPLAKMGARASVTYVEGKLEDADLGDLHGQVRMIQNEVRSMASELADMHLAVRELLKRVGGSGGGGTHRQPPVE